MKYQLRLLLAAENDVDDVAAFIARDSLDAALRFYDSVDQTYRQIRTHPERWPICEFAEPELANIRRYAVVGFRNYLVFYRVKGKIIEVVRVLHGARDIPSALADEVPRG